MTSPPRVLAVENNVEDMLKNDAPATKFQGAGVDGGSMFWSILQLFFALGIIIAIIYLLIRFLSTRTSLTRGNVIQPLGAHTLASNRSVHVIALQDKVYVIGVGENVTLLDTIEDAEQIEQLKEITLQADGMMKAAPGLADLIGRLRKKQAPQAEELQVADLTFDAALRKKLNSLKEQRTSAVQPEDDK
ncbi:HpcH/HpaI aldolase/citrate lyase family protein [Tumebacillus sp. BK434]|uniref:flagellar biosynthetic protein FliO n=1 Tax=Tumebacillus sp. BK434 TaxID=2512169 RepID=UPI0010DD7D93|nr:flagellar biosynthetic protein FliO [Tumebacillus sp. BK434]TCP58832.1 HpcH/HpaI aldolase/citrate lyase family protein [Tumebacillus sp. BK434]